MSVLICVKCTKCLIIWDGGKKSYGVSYLYSSSRCDEIKIDYTHLYLDMWKGGDAINLLELLFLVVFMLNAYFDLLT